MIENPSLSRTVSIFDDVKPKGPRKDAFLCHQFVGIVRRCCEGCFIVISETRTKEAKD